MYLATLCPSCGSSHLKKYPAIVSPFIASYVLGKPPGLSPLCECTECSFRFFESRFDVDEIAHLYQDYRGKRYYQERHRHEFWYTDRINDGIGKDAKEIKIRQDRVEEMVHEELKGKENTVIQTVLDYGGDRGQFIPASLGKERFVYEISDVPTVPGVTAIKSVDEIHGRHFDFIMLCHVLEHCSEPI
ncbi:MAG: hypothetical protein Q7S00_07155, partial [bacterium]|nr:hypothetical protein [bacterium]